jgi:hypothetical protein
MKSIILKLLAVLVVVGLFSCKKESAKSKTELLTQAGWRQSNGEMKTGASGTWSVDPSFSSMSACEKDDITLFKTGGSFEINEGASKCSPSDPQLIYTGVWAFQNNETEISIVGQGVASIELLNETTLVITYSDTFGGTTYYYRETYVH